MPPSPEQLARREEAGQRYAAALAELVDALVDLSAIEGSLPSLPPGEGHLFTFAAWQPDHLAELRHRQFAPTLPKSIKALVAERKAELKEIAA